MFNLGPINQACTGSVMFGTEFSSAQRPVLNGDHGVISSTNIFSGPEMVQGALLCFARASCADGLSAGFPQSTVVH